MRVRRILGVAVGVVLAGWLVLSVWQARTGLRPPTLAFVSGEPASMVDSSGAELWLVDFTINNPNPTNQSEIQANTFYFKDAGRVIEARVRNHWNDVQGKAAMSEVVRLTPGQQYEGLLLAPVGADSCRVWLQYASQATGFSVKGVSEWIALRLPVSVRSRISYQFWRWVGFPRAGPSGNWRKICVELPLPQPPHNRQATPPEPIL